MKYSSFLSDERQHATHFDNEPRFSALPPRQEYGFKPQEKYSQYEDGHYDNGPRFSNNPPAPNRMTSINININSLQEKKESPRVNVRLSKNKFGAEQKFGE
jgi:hypothetical protein